MKGFDRLDNLLAVWINNVHAHRHLIMYDVIMFDVMMLCTYCSLKISLVSYRVEEALIARAITRQH
eukprot:scaffold80927_cov42-Attheya_sp.AAC.3